METNIPFMITPDGDFRVTLTVDQMKDILEKSTDPSDVLGLTYTMPEHVRQFLRHAFLPPFISNQQVEKTDPDPIRPQQPDKDVRQPEEPKAQ